MSIPNEALQKLLLEIEQKATFTQQQIPIVKAQLAAKARKQRMLQLTSSEVDLLPKETNVYRGVGKMFMWCPVADAKQRLASESLELKSDTSNLEKKLHYLETTYKNSRNGLEQLFKPGPT